MLGVNHELMMMMMMGGLAQNAKLKTATEAAAREAIAKQEQLEREAKAQAALQAIINDLKVQLNAKDKAWQSAEDKREAAERRLAALDAIV
jgi:uncharacterized protein YlxW (UPF0749 family)